LPPGRSGPPLLGETLSFLRDPFGFLASRRAAHGRVFRTRILGRNVAVLAGPDAVAAFLDAENVTRELAHPNQVRTLFGGINMNMFDGARHLALKAMALEAFDHAALASYLPPLEELVASTLRKAAGREVSGVALFRQLAIEGIARNVFGLSAGPETDALREDYGKVIDGLLAVPLPLPGTRFGRAVRARDRIFARFRTLLAQHRQALALEPARRQDGLDRMLAARHLRPDGTTQAYGDEELLLELHHIVMAGYIVFGLFVELVRRLDEQPSFAARARQELADAFAATSLSAGGALTPAILRRLIFSERLVREAKRTAPILPLVFGKARRDFTCHGYRIPAGWDVHLALSLCNDDPEVFAHPELFDPERYAEPRQEDQRRPHAYVPQGGGPPTGHRCLGFDYSTMFGQVFLAVLLRGYTFARREPTSAYDTGLPREPKDGQRLTLEAAV